MNVHPPDDSAISLVLAVWEKHGVGYGENPANRVWTWEFPGGILAGAVVGNVTCFWRIADLDILPEMLVGIADLQREYGYAYWNQEVDPAYRRRAAARSGRKHGAV